MQIAVAVAAYRHTRSPEPRGVELVVQYCGVRSLRNYLSALDHTLSILIAGSPTQHLSAPARSTCQPTPSPPLPSSGLTETVQALARPRPPLTTAVMPHTSLSSAVAARAARDPTSRTVRARWAPWPRFMLAHSAAGCESTALSVPSASLCTRWGARARGVAARHGRRAHWFIHVGVRKPAPA